MRVSTAFRWTTLALLGILVAAAVSIAASRLASQQIGLASEPISAGDALAPARKDHRPAPTAKRGTGRRAKHAQPSRPPGAPTQTPVETAPAPSPPGEATEPSHANGDGEQGDGGADD